jgi:hypothetical protein
MGFGFRYSIDMHPQIAMFFLVDAPLSKSRDPHLVAGEKQLVKRCRYRHDLGNLRHMAMGQKPGSEPQVIAWIYGCSSL